MVLIHRICSRLLLSLYFMLGKNENQRNKGHGSKGRQYVTIPIGSCFLNCLNMGLSGDYILV